MMTTTEALKTTGPTEYRALRSAPVPEGGEHPRLLLAPWGMVESTSGDFVVDEESARLAIAAFEAHGTDLPIDYEHQTLGGAYAAPSGRAPAAGWIKRIVAEPGVGLFGEIEWTEEARKLLAGKEYRYLSPVAIVRKSDRKLVGIHSAALTNKPAIVRMQPIVNRDGPVALGETDGSLSALKLELDLPVDAPVDEVLVAASRRLVVLEQDAKDRRVAQRVSEAVRSGKLVEAQRAWAEALVAREDGLFEEWLRTAPVVVQPGRMAAGDTPGGEGGRQRLVASRARSEFRSNPALARLTSEEAYVADTLRQAAVV